jgi:MCP family monocarboxylic acid transporter-like MFS transporter 10
MTPSQVNYRVALGFGMAACGTSVGGIVFPIAVRKLLPLVGFPWTMRITGFIIMLALGLGMSLVRLRLPPSNIEGGIFNFSVLRNPAYVLYSLNAFIGFVGLYTGPSFRPITVMGC